MNLNEYQKLAQRTSNTTGKDKIKNGCLGLIGETGEIVDALKKWLFQSGENPPFPKDKFINEMGDVLWYCAEVISGFDWEMENVFAAVVGFFSKNPYPPYDLEEVVVSLSNCADWVYENCRHCPCDGDTIKPDRIIDSLRDIYGLLLDLCKSIETSIDEIAEANIEKLKKRYPDGFDPERSMHRPEYQNSEEGNGGSTEGMLFNARNHLV